MGCGCGKSNRGAVKTAAPAPAAVLYEVVKGTGQVVLSIRDQGVAKARVRKLREQGDQDAYHRKAGTTTALPL